MPSWSGSSAGFFHYCTSGVNAIPRETFQRWNTSAVYGSSRPGVNLFAFGSPQLKRAGPGPGPFVVDADVFADPDFLRFSKETTIPNADRLTDFHTLNVRVDDRRRFGGVSIIALLDLINLDGRSNLDSLEWDERRGVNLEQGLETFPTYRLKLEF